MKKLGTKLFRVKTEVVLVSSSGLCFERLVEKMLGDVGTWKYGCSWGPPKKKKEKKKENAMEVKHGSGSFFGQAQSCYISTNASVQTIKMACFFSTVVKYLF